MLRQDTGLEELKVFTVDDRHVIHVPAGRGEELCHHLASHGIQAELSRAAQSDQERLILPGDVDVESVQALLDHWER